MTSRRRTSLCSADSRSSDMELQFDAIQEFQTVAVEAIADLFEGQPKIEFELQFATAGSGATAVANRMDLDDDVLLANLRRVQEFHEVPVDDALELVSAEVETANGREKVRFPNFSVEMETGTGKTYVYLRTIHELSKTYGFKKFVIVVPSVAIREGVLKSLQSTKEHFQTLYDYERVEFTVYDSTKIS